jgi:hypothetical protein
MSYLHLHDLITLIDEPNRSSASALFEDYKERMEVAPGSLTKHQAWPKGYVHHLEETMNFGRDLYALMSKERALDFNLSDIILVLFLHDLEKPFRYVEGKTEFHTHEEKEVFIQGLIEKYGFILNDNHHNALKYTHGEGNDFNRTERVQKPLAAFVHVCDTVSARIWYDYPRERE